MPVEKVVLEVQQQFFKAGTGGVKKAELGLGGGSGEAAAFGDVLPPVAGCHDHLVSQPGVWVEKLLAKPVGGVVDECGGLGTCGGAVTAGWAEALGLLGLDGSAGLVGCCGVHG